MLQNPESGCGLPTGIRSLEHFYAKLLCQSLVLRPGKLLDQTLLDAEDRIQRNIPAIARVQRCGQPHAIGMLKDEMLPPMLAVDRNSGVRPRTT